jgi:predicted GTPase
MVVVALRRQAPQAYKQLLLKVICDTAFIDTVRTLSTSCLCKRSVKLGSENSDNNNASSQTNQDAKDSILRLDRSVRNILLIGASQNGKSALANFLASGLSTRKNKSCAFTVGTGIKACTKEMKSETASWTRKYLPKEAQTKAIITNKKEAIKHEKTAQYQFRIIDTPGIGDSDKVMEERNMTMLYRELKRMRDSGEQLSLALLVVKFPPFLDANYEANIRFYQKMLPAIMQRNVMLVITAVKNDEDWLEEHKVGGKHPEQTIEEVVTWVTKMLGKDTSMRTVMLNSLFLPNTADEADALEARESIFEDCVNLPSVPLNDLRLPKTSMRLVNDAKALERLDGTKKGLLEGIVLAQKQMAGAAEIIQKYLTEISALNAQLAKIEDKIHDMDNAKLCEIHSQTFTDGWHFFWKASSHFDCNTMYIIRDRTFSMGYPTYDIDEHKRIKGTTLW